jgi:uncharacterized membrane protein
MVEATFDDQHNVGTIVLRPNRSWTWQANRYLLYTLMAVSGTIAIALTARGLWLVLPFTVLEMSVLFCCLYYCVRRTHRQEVLRLSADELVLESGHERPEQVHRYPRFFARFRVERARHPWYATRIRIEARGHRHPVGDFLGNDEKHDLVRHVRDLIRRLESRHALSPTPRDRWDR